MSEPITLSVGQAVHWPHAVNGIAQIDELRRSRVRLVYRTKRGTTRFTTVSALSLAGGQQWMPGVHNVLDRGVLKRSKVYPPPRCARRRSDR